MKRVLHLCACIGLLAGPALADEPSADLKICEILSNYFNQKFIAHRSDTAFRFGVSADPHANDPPGRTMLATDLKMNAENCAFSVVVGDLSVDSIANHRKLIESVRFPFTGKVTMRRGDETKQMTFPETPRPAPPIITVIGNHEVHVGKRFYFDLYPGLAVPEKLWVHNAAHYTNKHPGPNGNGNYVFYSFNYGGKHFICLDSWGDPKRFGGSRGDFIYHQQFRWLEADLQIHKGMETFVFNHSLLWNGRYRKNPKRMEEWLVLRNTLTLMAILKKHPDVKWTFSGHAHSYYFKKWAHIHILQIRCARMGRSGVIAVEKGRTRWSRYDHKKTWSVPAQPGRYYDLLPQEPDEVVDFPIPPLPPYTQTLKRDPWGMEGLFGDTTPPGSPSGLKLRRVDSKRHVANSIPLQWTPAEGADFYEVFRDGKRVGGSHWPYFTDYDLRGGKAYRYEVWGRDIAGHKSAKAATGSFRAPE